MCIYVNQQTTVLLVKIGTTLQFIKYLRSKLFRLKVNGRITSCHLSSLHSFACFTDKFVYALFNSNNALLSLLPFSICLCFTWEKKKKQPFYKCLSLMCKIAI